MGRAGARAGLLVLVLLALSRRGRWYGAGTDLFLSHCLVCSAADLRDVLRMLTAVHSLRDG